MKTFAWRVHTLQTTPINERSPGKHGEEKMSRRIGTDQRPTSTPRRQSKTKPALFLSSTKIDSRTDVWSEHFVPESPPPLPVISFEDPFHVSITPEEFKNGQLPKVQSTKPLKAPRKSNHNSMSTPNLEFLTHSSRNTSTSTIFQDPQHPITIVLTTPEDEIPEPTFTPALRTRSTSVTSLPVLPSQRPNPSYLMLPSTPTHSDPRRLRQAQEFREIRKWLTSFLNAKGDQFPHRLRRRMMDIYGIRLCDLNPAVQRKWEEEEAGLGDEGVQFGKGEGDEMWDQKESLRVLGQAMRERIEEAHLVPKARPKSVSSPTSTSTITERPRSRKNSIKTTPRDLASIPDVDDEELELAPTWLGPLISTSTSSRDSILANEQYLKKSYSAPNLHPEPRPVLPSTYSADTVPQLKARSGSVVDLEGLKGHKNRSKRGSWFGAVREAFGGRPAKVR